MGTVLVVEGLWPPKSMQDPYSHVSRKNENLFSIHPFSGFVMTDGAVPLVLVRVALKPIFKTTN